MPVQSGETTCPKCGEDRPTLITEVIDPMGKRFYCAVCAHEFREGSERSYTNQPKMKA